MAALVTANVTNQVAALKELYTGDDFMKDLVYKKNPFLALVPKDESPSGFAGKYIPVPLIYGTPQGRSANFTNAQNNQTAPSLASFFVYRVSNYQLVTITNELLEATKEDAGAFVDEAKLNMDTGFRNISNDLALDLFRNADGQRGSMSALAGGTLTLGNSADIVNFEVGQTLISYQMVSGNYTQSTSGSTGYVIGVNRASGVILVSNTPGGTASGSPTSWNATNFPFLAVQGDSVATTAGAVGSTSNFVKVSGLSAWLNSNNVTTSDSYWNVNRSADPTRLAGVYFDGSGESIEEGLIDGASLVAREGGQPDMCFMNFNSWAALEKSLGAKVQYVDVKHDEADIAFAGIKIHAPYGPITVIPDRNCPSQTAFLLQLDTWKFRSLGKAPHILTYGMEGLEGLRVGTADSLEVRIGYYGNLICNAPGWNARIALSQ